MCGIAGIYGLADENIIKRMLDAMAHRGPDDEGIITSTHLYKNNLSPNIPVSLGHKRLSIIDLSAAGHQPMPNEDKTIWIIHNGEIYNFKELRTQLEEKGHRFISKTDTEVIIHAYEAWGEDCLERLRGMFAFSIWDINKNRLFLARDRLGIKPLYYTQVNDKFIFASELKAILAAGLITPDISPQALHHYLSFYSVPQPYTILQRVNSLLPGHKMIVSQSGIKITKYWDIDFKDKLNLSETQIKEELRRLLEEAIKLRLISDVPLGAFLSGGVDSSCVVGLMSKIKKEPLKTFSIGFGEEGKKINELSYAKIVASKFGTEHTEVIISGRDVYNDLDKIIEAMDQPTGNGVNSYLVSKAAKQKVTVALSGLGGDELFAGYPQFKFLKNIQLIKNFIPYSFQHTIARCHSLLPSKIKNVGILRYGSYLNKSFPEQYTPCRILYSEKFKENLYSKNFLTNHQLTKSEEYLNNYIDEEEVDVIEKVSKLELKTYMPNTLLRDMDAMSMSHSLEVRVPLLDHKLVEFILRIPSRLKLRKRKSKYILIEALKDILPKEVIHRKKMGFELPIGSWLRNELKNVVKDVFSQSCIEKRRIFDYHKLNEVYTRFMEGKESYMKIWSIVVLELWMRRFID